MSLTAIVTVDCGKISGAHASNLHSYWTGQMSLPTIPWCFIQANNKVTLKTIRTKPKSKWL